MARHLPYLRAGGATHAAGGPNMANAQSVQTAIPAAFKLHVVEKRKPVTESLKLLGGFDVLLLKIACPSHAWSWPRSNKIEAIEGFACHQTCTKCASQRLFDSRSWRPGPYYKRGIETGVKRSVDQQKVKGSGYKPNDRPVLCLQK